MAGTAPRPVAEPSGTDSLVAAIGIDRHEPHERQDDSLVRSNSGLADAVPPGLRGARALRGLGLTPVPLRPAGQRYQREGEWVIATGKEPLYGDYAERALRSRPAHDETTWSEHPCAGVGVLLGVRPWADPHRDGWEPGEGIIDLEEDDPEAAAAPLARIFPGGVPDTLRFPSSLGMHRFFRVTPEELSGLRLAGACSSVIKDDPAYPGLEIRFGSTSPGERVACQSVCPPTATLLKDGTLGPARGWIMAPIARAPSALFADLIEHGAAAKKHRARRLAEERRLALRDEPVPREELFGLSPIEMFRYALEHAGHRYQETGSGSYTCSCTAADHRDEDPSMVFDERDNGNLRVTCFGRRCTLKEIMEGVGLRAADAFARGRIVHRPRPARHWSSGTATVTRSIDLIQDGDAEAWEEEQDGYARALIREPGLRHELADLLGLPVEALDALEIGFREKNYAKSDEGDWEDLGGAWTWPERDHRGRVVCLQRRFVDPEMAGARKKLIASRRDRETGAVTHRAARGLTIPAGFATRPGPVLVVEGESDVLALTYAGKAAVGRPGNRSGLEDVARLLKGDARDVLVLGERDAKPGGAWPGDPGPVARDLGRKLGRPVGTLLPPEPFKDAREWIVAMLPRMRSNEAPGTRNHA